MSPAGHPQEVALLYTIQSCLLCGVRV